MKKLTTILFLLLATTLSYGQTTKPTVEETVQYIKNELQGKKIERENDRLYGTTYYSYSMLDNIKMNGCILRFTYTWMVTTTFNGIVTIDENSKTDEGFIDFNRVEEIDVYRGFGNMGSVTFNFRQKKTDGTIVSLFILVNVPGSDKESWKSSKLYKAFQHLRKLCDAPEPISFD